MNKKTPDKKIIARLQEINKKMLQDLVVLKKINKANDGRKNEIQT